MSRLKENNNNKKMIDELYDSAIEAASDWSSDFIKTNVPKAMDFISGSIKEAVKSIASGEKMKTKIREHSQRVYELGFELGEKSKENNFLIVMRENGFSENQIQGIIEQVNQEKSLLK